MKEEVSFEEFVKLDLRVGKVVEASEPEWSRRLLKLVVDFGGSSTDSTSSLPVGSGQGWGRRTIFAGVKGMYKPEWFVGRKGVFVVNLASKKMGGEESQGMMLMSVEMDDEGVETMVVPLAVDEKVPVGTVVR